MRVRAAAASVIAFGALLAACSDSDPCDGAATCLRIDIDSATVDAIDELQLDVVYGDLHSTTATSAGRPLQLPVSTAIFLELPDASPVRVDVVAAGILADTALGTGVASRMIAMNQHSALQISLGPVNPCTDGRLYCGGNTVTGDFSTLYRCNVRAVPTARGRCTAGCVVHPGESDACGASAVCQDGGKYCGGDKLEGDPQTLYVCAAGAGTMPKLCANGCVIRPGSDDICRAIP
ncbi:MAG TPA: hypothetical protein VLM79_07865 [Kofleriaceae bacterium]|nr:hypothetical protein [Kofleriaceae bacterium]